MSDFIQMSGGNVPKEILGVIKSHLEQLHLQLREYFPVPDDRDLWIRNPFAEGLPTNLSLTPQEEDSLAELSTD
ncbi:Zinc finger BED domain-containing protein 5 [Blattella germanica]|nr:Zinc finger BED domain-containing protein 5 [Blattella germanica]